MIRVKNKEYLQGQIDMLTTLLENTDHLINSNPNTIYFMRMTSFRNAIFGQLNSVKKELKSQE